MASTRHQLAVIGAIVLFTGSFGACSVGIRSVWVRQYAMPACEQACGVRHAQAAEIDVRMGKRDRSACVCSDGARLPSAEADTVGALSFFVPAGTTVIGGMLVLLAARKRALAREPHRRDL